MDPRCYCHPCVLLFWSCALLQTNWTVVRCTRAEREPTDAGAGSTLMSIFGLTVALLTIALVPIDIYLVSSMKNPNGDFEVRHIAAVAPRACA